MKKILLISALAFACLTLAAQPINDNPCNAIPLTVDSACTMSFTNTFGATSYGGLGTPGCGSTFKDIWFSITVPESGMFTIETAAGTITDGAMAIYSGPCDDLVWENCDDDSGPGNMPYLELEGFIPGSTAYIRFYKCGGGGGTFSICVWDDNPPMLENYDCGTAQHLCTEEGFTGTSPGMGDEDDLTGTNSGCLNNEHESSWYYITFDHPGEFGFEITPLNPNDNYNFAIWGPDVNCLDLGDPIRCSYASHEGTTGMKTGATDESEGVPGDGWVKHIPVNTGDTYIFMIDNYSESGEGFTFEFTGPPVVDCIDYLLPVIISAFTGYDNGAENVLNWTTESEINNDHFLVERSENGSQFYSIGKVTGNGTSSSIHQYEFIDEAPLSGTSYYRLKQVDQNGGFQYSTVIEIANVGACSFIVSPNPSAGEIYIDHLEQPGSDYVIELIGSTGSQQFTFTGTATSEFVRDKIVIPHSGIYYVIIRNGGTINASKVIIR